ncbi:MAG: tripartite tricarboxylate transporter substrate binding protein [Deltaproteobacteria bacterium]|nr:tripartite tricarboxylate transporter substrate binding protein [Deltaproteobacteria bacterium]MBW1945500.1 tripartite tricarboxylate transporter substrate binding protein [Deltaproteobacteria bacterium]
MKKLSVLLVLILTVVFCFSAAWAGDYPTKPITMLIPFGAGGSTDLLGRALANDTESYLGKPIVPINKTGAAGGIMYSTLKNAKPDGYTIGWASLSVNTCTNIGNVPFDYTAFIHVCRIGYTGMPIAVRADAPWKTIPEFVAYAKKNPGKIKIGNAGTGSGTHLTAVLVEKVLGIKVIHVPLGAKRRVPSLLGGEVEAICVPLPEAAPQVKAGNFRFLMMTTAKRAPLFPNVPTLMELGYKIDMELFNSVALPKGTPESVVAKVRDSFHKGSQGPTFVKIAKQKGFTISFLAGKEFADYIAMQDKKIANAMKAGGLVKKTKK